MLDGRGRGRPGQSGEIRRPIRKPMAVPGNSGKAGHWRLPTRMKPVGGVARRRWRCPLSAQKRLVPPPAGRTIAGADSLTTRVFANGDALGYRANRQPFRETVRTAAPWAVEPWRIGGLRLSPGGAGCPSWLAIVEATGRRGPASGSTKAAGAAPAGLRLWRALIRRRMALFPGAAGQSSPKPPYRCRRGPAVGPLCGGCNLDLIRRLWGDELTALSRRRPARPPRVPL